MKIQSLQVKNNFLGWGFEEIIFSTNLTLLVGGSGVGKTQILRSIDDIQDIANGKSINGLEWKIKFSTSSNKVFTWSGQFSAVETNDKLFEISTSDEDDDDEEKVKTTIVFETLFSGEELIVNRSTEAILFNGNYMPKLSSTQSIIHILKEEESIKEVTDAFRKITFKDHTRREGMSISFTRKPVRDLMERYATLDEIKNSSESIRVKLFLCSELNLTTFNDIKERFIEVFPHVEDVRVAQLEDKDFPFNIGQTIPVISIKEHNVAKWINEGRMSSGMLRTILHISEIFLSNDGSVILIDEFENSLGVNCIDVLTDDLLHENKNLQFIATSHHPYIINNIPYEYWKIVSREGGEIKVGNASDYELGRSKQDAFIQLIKAIERQ